MIPIFTALANGQALAPQVLNGILRQSVECCLVPVTSPGTTDGAYSERSRNRNLVEAIRVNPNDFFLYIDSDVVLADDRIIEKMVDHERNLQQPVVICTTRGEQACCCPFTPHGLILLRKGADKRLAEFLAQWNPPNDGPQVCGVCAWLTTAGPVMWLQSDKVYEVKRPSIKL